METRDIKGLLALLEQFAKGTLEYDKVDVECRIKEKGYTIQVNCDDSFQSKGDWKDRVEQVLIDEPFDWEVPLEQASAQLFKRLESVMKRPERELRYGLNIIGKSIEAGASYTTHVGLEFLASMKREQEKTMLLLPNRTGQVPEASPSYEETSARANAEADEYFASLAQPQEGPKLKLVSNGDDDIPF